MFRRVQCRVNEDRACSTNLNANSRCHTCWHAQMATSKTTTGKEMTAFPKGGRERSKEWDGMGMEIGWVTLLVVLSY
jgi:hypothetical protein